MPRCKETYGGGQRFHTVPIFTEAEGRPAVLYCTRCGLPFEEDPEARQGYSAAPHRRRRLR